MDIKELLYHTSKNKASDLHIRSGMPPYMRINGEVLQLQMDPIDAESARKMLFSLMNAEQQSEYETEMELDFAVNLDNTTRFRVNVFSTLKGISASFRVVPVKVLSLEELGMPDILKKLASLRKGLVLVTGPTGSGKSTTLAAMVNYINTHMAKHIITVEDPIEFIHTPKKSLINQRELHSSTHSFARALKSALRQDPDVIMVGEMRDLETIELALTAAETGHLVFGTLHTNSAAKTIDRIVDAFPMSEKDMVRSMLSTSLEGVVSQLLYRRKDNQGRVAALEIMVGTSAIRNMIRENKIAQIPSLIQVGTRSGMRTMKESLYALVEKGIVSPDEIAFSASAGDNNAGGEADILRSGTSSAISIKGYEEESGDF